MDAAIRTVCRPLRGMFTAVVLAVGTHTIVVLAADTDTAVAGQSAAVSRPVRHTSGYVKTADGVVVTPGNGPAHRVRLQVVSPLIIHVIAIPDDKPALPKSLMVSALPATHGQFELTRRDDILVLKTTQVRAEINLTTGSVAFDDRSGKRVLAERDRGVFTPVKIDGREFYSIQQVFNPGTDEAFYGLGQHQNAQMNYNGEDVVLAQHNMDVAIPFVLSSRNYGVLWDNNSITRFGDPRPYGLASRDLKIYDAHGTPGGFTASYYSAGKLQVTRVEPDVNYQYFKDLAARPVQMLGTGLANSPGVRVDAADETVVWEGRIEADVSGVHKFRLYASSYFKLYLDGRLVEDGWRQNWNAWYHNFEAAMVAGKPMALRIEWTPDNGNIALLHNNPLPQPERHSLSFASEVAHAIDYYFIAGADLDQVIGGYRQLTGKAVLPPRWVYGFWQSRQRYKTQDEILDVVREYRRRGIPLDNIVEDWFYWREDDWGSHVFDPTRFPDPRGLIAQVHDLHAHFMISVWPKFYPATAHYRELDARGFIYRRNVELGVKDWVGKGYSNSFYDPYSAPARAMYWRQIQDSLGGLGVDAWWLDASEPDIQSNIDIEENKRRIGPTALGPGAAFYNSYPLLHTTAVFEGERGMNPDRRSFILTRSAFAGQQRNSAATWSGDVASRWTDLYNQISAGVNFSMSGIPNWGFDIGGFALEKRFLHPGAADLDEWRELNLRWFQFGALVPLFRSHGEEPYREIYNLAPQGSAVYDSLVWYDRLRYRLMPYIYSLAADTYHHDATLMRGLVMDFPGDSKVLNINDEYLFGRALLVSPVHEYRARTRKVYLPAGVRWFDFHTAASYEGGQEITAAAPLARLPVFVKAGSILPLGPDIQYTDQKSEAPVTLYVYTGRDGRFELYEDDGLSNGYERGEFSRIPMAYEDATGSLRIGARTGHYPGMAARRQFNVRWISANTANPADFDAKPDASVVYSGQSVAVKR